MLGELSTYPCKSRQPGQWQRLTGCSRSGFWIFIANANASHLGWKLCAILAHGALWGLLQGEEHRDEQSGAGGEEEEQLQPEPEGRMPLPAGLQGRLRLEHQQGRLGGDLPHRHPSQCNSIQTPNAVCELGAEGLSALGYYPAVIKAKFTGGSCSRKL